MAFELELQGINRQSTFTGFCSAHDGGIFRVIDNLQPVIGADFCNRLAYRSVCKELYLKQQLQYGEGDLRLLEVGRSGAAQRQIRENLEFYNRGMAAAVRELDNYKSSLELAIAGQNEGWMHTAIIVDGLMPVLASAPFQPLKTIFGKHIQSFDEQGTPLQNVIFNYIATQNGGAIVMTLKRADTVAREFLDEIVRLSPEVQIPYLVGFSFEMFENLAVRPDWWENLPAGNRSQLNRAANRGANPWSVQDECAPLQLVGRIQTGIRFAYLQEFGQ